MVDLVSENLDLNTPIVEDAEGAVNAPFIATKYFEDYLFAILTDLNAINDDLVSGVVTDGANVGGFAEVFQEKNGTVLEFRTLQSSDGSVSITQNDDDIDLQAAQITGSEANSILTYDLVGGEFTELPEFTVSWSGGVATISVEDDLGALQTGITIDADGQLGLSFDGTEVANTRAASAGGLFANNTNTGAGFERVLTASDLITNITDLDAAVWQVFYSNGSGDVTELALGASGEVLTSNGATSAPSFQAVASLPTPTVEHSILTGDLVGGDFDELPEVTIAWTAGVMTLAVEDDGAALQDMIVIDADTDVELFYDPAGATVGVADGKSLATRNFGIALYSSNNTYIGISAQRVEGTQDWQIGMDTTNSLGDWSAWLAGDNLVIRTTDVSAGDTTHFRAVSGAQTELYYGNVLEFETKSGGVRIDDELEVDGNINHDGSNIGLFGTAPVAQQTITGSRGGNVALANLLTGLANYGLIIDSTVV